MLIFRPNRSSAGLNEHHGSGIARKLRRAKCGSEVFCNNHFTVPTALSTRPLLWGYLGLLVIC